MRCELLKSGVYLKRRGALFQIYKKSNLNCKY